jgi:hypothetical protein
MVNWEWAHWDEVDTEANWQTCVNGPIEEEYTWLFMYPLRLSTHVKTSGL